MEFRWRAPNGRKCSGTIGIKSLVFGVGDRNEATSMVVPHAYFGHPTLLGSTAMLLAHGRGRQMLLAHLCASDYLKGTLYEFTRRFDIDLLIVQNGFAYR